MNEIYANESLLCVGINRIVPFRVVLHIEAIDLQNIPLVPRTFRITERHLEQNMREWENKKNFLFLEDKSEQFGYNRTAYNEFAV